MSHLFEAFEPPSPISISFGGKLISVAYRDANANSKAS